MTTEEVQLVYRMTDDGKTSAEDSPKGKLKAEELLFGTTFSTVAQKVIHHSQFSFCNSLNRPEYNAAAAAATARGFVMQVTSDSRVCEDGKILNLLQHCAFGT